MHRRDERSAGEWRSAISWDSDCYPFIGCVGWPFIGCVGWPFIGCVGWGTFELVGPEGSWVGTATWTLGHGEQGTQLATAIGEGTDTHDGWVYIAHSSAPDPYVTSTSAGFTCLGDPPAIDVNAPPPTE